VSRAGGVRVLRAPGLPAGAAPTLLALGLLFSNCYGGALTHYGSGPAPILYDAGYTHIKPGWVVGAGLGHVSCFVFDGSSIRSG